MTLQEKLELFKSLFRGRDDCYGSGEGKCIKEPITDAIISKHLTGRVRIGVYPLITDKIHFSVLDIDREDNEPLAVEDTKQLWNTCQSYGLAGYIERSKSKGYHIWHFFSEPVLALNIRRLMMQILADAGIDKLEIFPKQDSVSDAEYGNYINLPLFKSNLPTNTAFLEPLNWKPYPVQWEFLSKIKKITPKEIDDIIAVNSICLTSDKSIEPEAEATRTILTVEPSPEGDIETVIEQCEFIQNCIENAETLPEQLWYDMICNLATLPGGREKIHEYSKPYPTYNYNATEKKIEHAIKDAPAPTTCELIKEHGFICEKICNVKAPAGWGYKNPVIQLEQKSSGSEPVAYKEDTAEIEPFPETEQVWFNKYLSLFDGVTEAPDSYHFMGFASVVGMMLNRKVYFRYVHNLYPNLYILLVGRSGRERKDTAMRFNRNLINETCKAQILSSLSSYEGLLQAMTKPEADLIDGIEYNHAICILSEFNALLKKARNDSISNLIPELCSLYDTPNKLSLLTRGNPLKIENPFFSILAGIQPGILTKEMQSGDVHGGFTGRFLYVRGIAKDPVAIPAELNQNSWNEIVEKLKSVNNEWESRNKEGVYKLEWTEESKLLWTEFYNWHFVKKNETSELMATLLERIPEQILKLALIFTALEGFFKIEDYILEDAIKIGKWCMVNTEKLFGDFGQTLREKSENKIMDMLKYGDMSRRKLQQNSHIDTDTFSHAILNLISAGLVEEFREGKKKIIRLAD